MRTSERLPHLPVTRQFGGAGSESAVHAAAVPNGASLNDLRLFALTFAWGFLFTSIFIA